MVRWMDVCLGSEGGLVLVAAPARRGGPRVALPATGGPGALLAAPAAARDTALAGARTPAGSSGALGGPRVVATTAATTGEAAGATGLRHLRGGHLEARADLLDVDLEDRALLALP